MGIIPHQSRLLVVRRNETKQMLTVQTTPPTDRVTPGFLEEPMYSPPHLIARGTVGHLESQMENLLQGNIKEVVLMSPLQSLYPTRLVSAVFVYFPRLMCSLCWNPPGPGDVRLTVVLVKHHGHLRAISTWHTNLVPIPCPTFCYKRSGALTPHQHKLS